MRQSNEQLMERVKHDHDLDALEQLVERFKAPVYSLSYSMLRSREDAEEAAQDTFLKLYRARDLYEDGRGVEPWLLRIAGNTCRDLLRRRRASKLPTAFGEESNYLEHVVPDPRSVGADLESTSGAVRDEVARLSDRLRQPLVMKYVTGSTNRQIAETLGISVSNVKVRLARAKDVLQSRLDRILEA